MRRGERTRARLQEVALRLFLTRGFDEVTVEEVAAAAGVSHMTFFRHFPTKESVVLDDPYDPVIGEAVRAHDPTAPPLVRVVSGLLAAWATTTTSSQTESAVRDRLRLATGHPGLRARVWENNRRTEQVVVEALVDTGVEPLEARVAAGAALGALTAALLQWAEQHPAASLDGVVRRALVVLGAVPAVAS